MKRVFLFVLLTCVFANGGCASKEELQRGMDAVSSTWRSTNAIYLKKDGARVYKMEIEAARQSSISAMEELGFKIHNDTKTYLAFKAIAPAPLSKEEYEKVKEVEEPMMQAIAATEVGDFTSSMYVLTSGKDFDIVVTVRMIEEISKTSISLDFGMYYRKPNPFIIYGDQPPPEAVKMSIQKFWDAFENHASVITKQSIYELKG